MHHCTNKRQKQTARSATCGSTRDANSPLFRFGFPVFDRMNLHRVPVIGYQGVMNMLATIGNKFIDIMDDTCDDRYFEMMR